MPDTNDTQPMVQNDAPAQASVNNTQPSPTAAQQLQQQPAASPSQPGAQSDPAAPTVDLSGGENTSPDLGTAPQANVHPSLQRASLIHSIAQTLAGGPRYTYDIDPNSGRLISRPAPMSKSDIGMAIAMEAISGALGGLAAPAGPNAAGRAAAAGFTQAQQTLKQADAEQQQAASDALARSASIANVNFQSHQNALRLGQMEYDAHKQYVADAAPVLENLNQVGAVQASRVREDDLLSRFHVTKDMAVVDGIVPRMSPDGTQAKNKDGSSAWDNTYSVVDPEAKIEIPQDTMAMLAQHHVPGYYKVVDGKTQPVNLPSDTQVRAKFVVSGLASASAIKITEAGINKQLASIGDTDDASKLDVNLTQALESGAVSTKALQTFARYSNLPLDQIRPSMEKDKVDPDTIGQITSILPADAVEKIAQQRKAAEQKQAAQIRTDAAVDEAKRLVPVKAATAGAEARATVGPKASAAGAEESARLNAKEAFDDAHATAQTTPDALGFTPNVPGGMKEANKRQASFKKAADGLAQTEGTFQQFQSISQAIANGDMTGAQSVVALFDAIGLSATPLAGRGFRVNENVIADHKQARGWLGSLQAQLARVQTGAVITPQQVRDYAAIAAQARHSQYVNLTNEVHNAGLGADFILPTGNGQKIDADTARIYMTLSGGDPNKARAAATKKGWSF